VAVAVAVAVGVVEGVPPPPPPGSGVWFVIAKNWLTCTVKPKRAQTINRILRIVRPLSNKPRCAV
jgi:hypothetical protein